MKIRYRRCATADKAQRDYTVRTQDRPYGRWIEQGLVSSFGCEWAALGIDATAWTRYRKTRAEAVADMLVGRTYLDA